MKHEPTLSTPPLVVVMGVSGSGKTSVGQAVARQLNVPFADADHFHPLPSRAKMAAGIPLTDADRAPWLDALRRHLAGWQRAGRGGVLACSALKARYRHRLDVGGVAFRLLTAPPDVLRARLATRPGHFFPPTLLQSQLDLLEADPAIPLFDTGGMGVDETAAAIVASLGLRAS